MLGNGGSGYFLKRIVQPHLKVERLSLIKDAPVVYEGDLSDIALEAMHGVTKPKVTMRSSKTPTKRSRRTHQLRGNAGRDKCEPRSTRSTFEMDRGASARLLRRPKTEPFRTLADVTAILM